MCDLPIQQQNVNVLSLHSFSYLHFPHPQRVKDPSRRRLCVYKEIHGHIWPGSERFCLLGHLQSHGLLSIAQLAILSGSGVNRASGCYVMGVRTGLLGPSPPTASSRQRDGYATGAKQVQPL